MLILIILPSCCRCYRCYLVVVAVVVAVAVAVAVVLAVVVVILIVILIVSADAMLLMSRPGVHIDFATKNDTEQ
jgi:hypothetical protein